MLECSSTEIKHVEKTPDLDVDMVAPEAPLEPASLNNNGKYFSIGVSNATRIILISYRSYPDIFKVVRQMAVAKKYGANRPFSSSPGNV